MFDMKFAPKTGQIILAFCGTAVGHYAFFKNGKWLAPVDRNRLDLGAYEIHPVGWIY
jgi:hypothetical protein